MACEITLDINKHDWPSAQTFVLRQGDQNSLTLSITVVEDGEPFNLSGYQARFMAQLPNDKVIIDDCTVVGANTVQYTLPGALAQEVGTISLAYIVIYQGDDWFASTDCLCFIVKPGVDITAEEAQSILGGFDQIKSQLEHLLEQAQEQTLTQQTAWEQQYADQQDAFVAAEAQRDALVAETIRPIQDHTAITTEQIDALFNAL